MTREAWPYNAKVIWKQLIVVSGQLSVEAIRSRVLSKNKDLAYAENVPDVWSASSFPGGRIESDSQYVERVAPCHPWQRDISTSMYKTVSLDDHRVLEPPDPIPNSAVKWHLADGSVGFPHVRVGHRQALN